MALSVTHYTTIYRFVIAFQFQPVSRALYRELLTTSSLHIQYGPTGSLDDLLHLIIGQGSWRIGTAMIVGVAEQRGIGNHYGSIAEQPIIPVVGEINHGQRRGRMQRLHVNLGGGELFRHPLRQGYAAKVADNGDEIAGAWIACLQQRRRILLRVLCGREVANRLQANHPVNRDIVPLEALRMREAAHVRRAEVRGFLKGIGHEVDAVG